MAVAVLKTSLSDVRADLKRALDAIGYRPEKESFFIKPNLVRPFAPSRGVTTHPAVVEAFISLFPDRQFVIGDGTPAPRDYRRVLKVAGYFSLARRHGNVKLVNLDGVAREPAACGDMTLKLPRLLRTHEYVNIAKMKTHSQTHVSLCVKNQKGLLSLADKMRFHRKGLHEPVRQLGECVRPALNILDGIVALQGNGPSFFGRPLRAGALLAGRDAFEVDAAACRVMGLRVEDAKHLKPDMPVRILGDGIGKAARRFVPADKNWSIGRIGIYFDDHCCSVCLSNLPALRGRFVRKPLKLAKFVSYALKGGLVLVGGGTVPPDIGKKRVIFLGECGRKCAEAAGIKDNACIAGGCPFDPDEFLKLF